ncbi:hypothetical protein ACS0TY_018850 [Phlomoides rotata]
MVKIRDRCNTETHKPQIISNNYEARRRDNISYADIIRRSRNMEADTNHPTNKTPDFVGFKYTSSEDVRKHLSGCLIGVLKEDTFWIDVGFQIQEAGGEEFRINHLGGELALIQPLKDIEKLETKLHRFSSWFQTIREWRSRDVDGNRNIDGEIFLIRVKEEFESVVNDRVDEFSKDILDECESSDTDSDDSSSEEDGETKSGNHKGGALVSGRTINETHGDWLTPTESAMVKNISVSQRDTCVGGIENSNDISVPEIMRVSSTQTINYVQEVDPGGSPPNLSDRISGETLTKASGSKFSCGTRSPQAIAINSLVVDLNGPFEEKERSSPIESGLPGSQSHEETHEGKEYDSSILGVIDTQTPSNLRIGPDHLRKNIANRKKTNKPKTTGILDTIQEANQKEDSDIENEARKAWEVGKKLGLISKVTDEDIINQMEILERKDRARLKKNIRSNKSGAKKDVRDYGATQILTGGILSIWKNEVFHKSSSWNVRGVLVVNGFFTEDGSRGVLLNVYAPCSSSEKRDLWDIIQNTVLQNLDARVCVVGDFNSIRSPEERVGRRETRDNREIECFEEFITQSNLHEVKLVGRSFTWYHPDGSCKNHVPLFLQNGSKDWGPRPFRFMNTWIDHPQFKEFFHAKWQSYHIEGWAAYRLKEKLKLLKKDLRGWNIEIFGNIDFNIDWKKEEIEILDRIDDTMGLEAAEIIKRNKNVAELIRLGQWKEKLLAQRAKARWLRDGDVNSKYFHGWINRNRKANAIEGLGRGVRQDLHRTVGEGRDTKFWIDIWVGNETFKRSFNRLYNLSNQQDETISRMGRWEESEWVWELKWRRSLRKSEQILLNELMLHLSRAVLRRNEDDTWRWRHTSNGIFTTDSAYQNLGSRAVAETEDQQRQAAFHRLWKSYAPRRYQAIVWKLLHNRLPTKEKLQRMGIIPVSEDIKCALCGEDDKTIDHLLGKCRIVHSIWAKIYEWLESSMVLHIDPRINLLQHSLILGRGKNERIASTIWICTSWAICNGRNNVIFREKNLQVERMICEIKARSWNWVIAKTKDLRNSDFLEWSNDIRNCSL